MGRIGAGGTVVICIAAEVEEPVGASLVTRGVCERWPRKEGGAHAVLGERGEVARHVSALRLSLVAFAEGVPLSRRAPHGGRLAVQHPRSEEVRTCCVARARAERERRDGDS